MIYLIVFFEAVSIYTFMGQFFTYWAPTPVLATVLGGLIHSLWNLCVSLALLPIAWMLALPQQALTAATWPQVQRVPGPQPLDSPGLAVGQLLVVVHLHDLWARRVAARQR